MTINFISEVHVKSFWSVYVLLFVYTRMTLFKGRKIGSLLLPPNGINKLFLPSLDAQSNIFARLCDKIILASVKGSFTLNRS